MIDRSLAYPFSGDYPQERAAHEAEGSASPTTITHPHPEVSEQLAIDKTGAIFIKAPQKFFGKFLKVNAAERTTEEKEANQAVRTEFHDKLHGFFGPILAEYLYPDEEHEKVSQEGAPLTPQRAQKIVNKGMEMVEALAKYCEHYLDDAEKSVSQVDQLDQAMMKYADEQEAAPSKESGTMDLLSHAANAVWGGAMVTFAVTTKGHLSPADIFFSLDLLSSKKLSKGIEDFIKTRLMQHIEHHLESYLQEQRESHQPHSPQEEAMLRDALKLNAESLNSESTYPTVKSEVIRACDLSIEGNSDIHNPIEAINYIFLSPLEGVSTSGAHNRLFRDGVTAVIENFKKIQDIVSKTKTSTQELSKVKKAIATARQQIEGNGTWRDVEDQETVKIEIAPTKKKEKLFRPQWTRGI